MGVLQHIYEAHPLLFPILLMALGIVAIGAYIIAIWLWYQNKSAQKRIATMDEELRGGIKAANNLLKINQATMNVATEQAKEIADFKKLEEESLLLYQNQVENIANLRMQLDRSLLELYDANKLLSQAPVFMELQNQKPKPNASRNYYGLYLPATGDTYLFLPSAIKKAKENAAKNLEDLEPLKSKTNENNTAHA